MNNHANFYLAQEPPLYLIIVAIVKFNKIEINANIKGIIIISKITETNITFGFKKNWYFEIIMSK